MLGPPALVQIVSLIPGQPVERSYPNPHGSSRGVRGMTHGPCTRLQHHCTPSHPFCGPLCAQTFAPWPCDAVSLACAWPSALVRHDSAAAACLASYVSPVTPACIEEAHAPAIARLFGASLPSPTPLRHGTPRPRRRHTAFNTRTVPPGSTRTSINVASRADLRPSPSTANGRPR